MGFRRAAAIAVVTVFLLSCLTTAGFAQAAGDDLPAAAAPEAGSTEDNAPAADSTGEDAPAADAAGGYEEDAPPSPAPEVPGSPADDDGLYFEGSPYAIAVISAFDSDETPEPIFLGGGTVYRMENGQSIPVTNATYKWYNADSAGRPLGDCISTEEFLFNDGIHDYNPYFPGACYFLEEVYVGDVLVGTDFFTLVIVDTLRFELTAPTDSVGEGPVTITAELPGDWDYQLSCLKDQVPELSTETSILEGGQSYWDAGTLKTEEGLSADGKPTLTVQPFSSSAEYEEIHYVLEYYFEDVDHLGAIRIYSRSFQLRPMDPALTPGGASANLFAASPMSEQELRELYNELILPYHDPQADDPFALKAAEAGEDGSLTAASQNQMLSLVNFIRRCGGVNPITGISSRKLEQAQAGAMFLSEHGVLSHTAAEGIDAVANDGLMRSNLSSGLNKSGAPYNIVTLQINQFKENQASVMPQVNHRRLLLDNRLQTTAFGYAAPTETNNKTYLVTHVDGSELKTISRSSLEAYPGVGTFPVELMGMKGWSLGIGNGWTIPDPSAVSVTVTKDDGTVIRLSALEDPSKAYETAGDWFCVNSADVGSGPVVVFSPGSLYEDGDTTKTAGLAGQKVNIRIDGIADAEGRPVLPIEYSVAFVSLADSAGTTPPDPGTTDPGTTDPGTTDPGTTDPGTTDPGTDRPTLPELPKHDALKDDLSDMQITTWEDKEYLTGIAANTKPWTAEAILDGAKEALSPEEGDTIRLLSDADGEPAEVTGDDPAATGLILEIADENGVVKHAAVLVIYGDITGGGKVDIVQLTEIAKLMTGVKTLEGANLLAADINGNGAIDIADLSSLAKRLISGS